MRPWRLLDERPGWGGFMRIVVRRYEHEGVELEREIVGPGTETVSVLAITDDDRVVLARQFRPGPGRVLDELPGGGVDTGEDPAVAAERELREETGYAGDVRIVGTTWWSANLAWRHHVAVATGCRRVSDPDDHPHEPIDVVLLPLEGLRDHVRGGQLTDVAGA